LSAASEALAKQPASSTVEDGWLHDTPGAFICCAHAGIEAEHTKRAENKNEEPKRIMMLSFYGLTSDPGDHDLDSECIVVNPAVTK
jgi:hypothetical protein